MTLTFDHSIVKGAKRLVGATKFFGVQTKTSCTEIEV